MGKVFNILTSPLALLKRNNILYKTGY
jgi:hypothetical protein